MTAASRGLDALAGQLDELRREVEGLRGTLDADIDALASLLDDTDDGAGPAGAIPELRAGVDELHGHVAHLAQQIATLLEEPDSLTRLPSWSDMDAAQAEKAWTALITWMRRVLFTRYPPATEVVRECWFQHPELVEHLSWLHLAWVLAYRNPSASISTAAEWHARWLPTVLARTREILKPCYLQHVDDSRVPPERYHGFGQALTDHVRADLARRPRPAENSVCPPSSSQSAGPRTVSTGETAARRN